MSAALQHLFSPLIALLASVSLVLACGLMMGSMRRVRPVLRHNILFASLSAALVIPLLSLAVPRWDVAILPSTQDARPVAERATWTEARLAGPGQTQTAVPGQTSASAVEAREGDRPSHSLVTLLFVATWLLGTLAVFARVLVGRMRLREIAARACVADDAPWIRLLDEERGLAGVSGHVRLLLSPAAATPVTWGNRKPVILLPEDAREWSADHRRIVLRHELAHVARRDALAQSLSAIACAVYWFHPLALMVSKRMRLECERACDDRVVALGTEPTEYASHLLDIARAAREMRSQGVLSLAMARPSQLEGRLLAVLDASRPRAIPTRTARILASSLPLTLAIVGSAFHPVPRAAAHAGGAGAAEERVAPIVNRNVDILLRADPTLPIGAPVQLALSADENLVLVNDAVVHPLDLRAAIELVKQVRTTYGRDIPGGFVRMSAPPHRVWTMRPSDAEPYSFLLRELARAPQEATQGGPAARRLRFEEHPVVEVAVSDSTLARLMKTPR